jgi:hypothetical protein
MRRNIRRNRGGWPYRPKLIFDAASRRRANRAIEIIEHARDYVISKRDRDYDPADICIDPIHREALEMFDAAVKRIHQADDAAQAAAKKIEEGR